MNHLLIDENLPFSLAKHLPVPCSHATDLGRQPTDGEIWEHAREKNQVVLTRDADFFDRIILEGPPPKVIWVRLGNIRRKELESLLLRRWPQLSAMLADADLLEVHPESIESFSREIL
ncbi:DUF5615 family PIN-like protein [Haloferula sp. A504]|uniref:DUF5615 family PIN-like protein n=1 Tax=Haloferula sp. A504 TaxID=3373601 RepID=UPI0031C81A23|nr:DUF5615 family PIN-like protein [Verrucomicrobiaceae bacterium E54]